MTKEVIVTLMQGTHIDKEPLLSQIQRVPHVIGVHQFHIWQLTNQESLAAVTVQIADERFMMTVLNQVKTVLSDGGVNQSTVELTLK